MAMFLLGDSILHDAHLENTPLFKDRLVYNLSYPGASSSSIINSLKEKKGVAENYEIVSSSTLFWHCGVNDFICGEPISTIVNNFYNMMLIMAKLKKSNLIFLEVLEISKQANNNFINADQSPHVLKKIQDLNNIMSNRSSVDGFTFLSGYNRIINSDFLMGNYSYDGVHLNKYGYDIFCEVIINSLM